MSGVDAAVPLQPLSVQCHALVPLDPHTILSCTIISPYPAPPPLCAPPPTHTHTRWALQTSQYNDTTVEEWNANLANVTWPPGWSAPVNVTVNGTEEQIPYIVGSYCAWMSECVGQGVRCVCVCHDSANGDE